MAEAVAAFGLFINVMQLADYACQIVSKSDEIHKSADGSLIQNRDAEACARELLLRNQRLLESLGKSREERSDGQQRTAGWSEVDDADDLALQNLGKQCHDTARDLIQILTGLKTKSKLGSLRQALEWSASKEKVEKIEQRMKSIQEQIDSQTNFSNRLVVCSTSSIVFNICDFRMALRMLAAEQASAATEQKAGFASINESQRAMFNLMTRLEKVWGPQLTSPLVRHASVPFSERQAPQANHDLTIHGLTEAGAEAAIQSLLVENSAAIQAEDSQGQTALHIAARMGNHRLMLLLLRRGANVNAEDNDSSTPLHLAVKTRSARCVRLLVARFADKDAMDSFNKIPVQYAPRGSEEAWILTYGADIEAKNPSKATALAHFSYSGNYEVVKSLLEQAADVNSRSTDGPALFVAASKGFDKIVELLLEKEADVNATGSRGATALGNAALAGHTTTVKLLLTQPKIELNVTNSAHFTALADACTHSHEGVAIALIQAGADLEIVDSFGYGPLHSAALNGATNIVKELLRRPGINLQWRGRDGWTALAEAARQGHEDIVELLLDHGADPNIGGETDMRTPLHLAAGNGNAKIVKLLLEKGKADTEITSNEGYTALINAAENAHLKVVEALIEHGANANRAEVGKELWSPLKFATRGGGKVAKDLIRVLVLRGKADVNYQPGRVGTTALLEAVHCHRPDLVSELLKLGADANLTDSNPNAKYDKYSYCPPICLAANKAPLNEVVDYLRILVDEGKANVNAARRGGFTALHEVSIRGSVNAVQFLLAHGADRSIKTAGGDTTLDCVLRDQPPNWSAISNLLKRGS
jgi:ankyrin repeat protein